MMEEFIRKNISDEYADFYDQSSKKINSRWMFQS